MLALFALLGVASATGTASFLIANIPSGLPVSITIPSYTTNSLGTSNAVTQSGISGTPITFNSLPVPFTPSAVAFSWTPVSPTYQGVIYTILSSGLLVWNGTTTLQATSVFNWTAFYLKLNSSLSKITVPQNVTSFSPLTQNQIANFYNALSANGISIGVNSILYNVALGNVSRDYPYGQLINITSGKPFNAGTKPIFATYVNSTHTLSFINGNTTQAVSPVDIFINGVHYTKAGQYHVPVAICGSKVCVSGASTYPITGYISSMLQSGNRQLYNWKIAFGNGTTIAAGNSLQNNITIPFSYPNVLVGMSVNITLDSFGNNNYTAIDPGVTSPTGVNYYLTFNVLNTQATAVPTNAAILINVPASYAGNYVANDINAEWFWSGGTVATSFLVGNTANVLVKGGLSSNQVTYLINVPNATWLPASMTANAQIYLGWNGISSTGTALMDGIKTCEAPQLSNLYNSLDCGSKIYTVTYTNFPGTSTPSGWTDSGFTINNGVFAMATGTQNTLLSTATYLYSTSNALDWVGNFLGNGYGQANLRGGHTDSGSGGAAHAVVWCGLGCSASPIVTPYSFNGVGNTNAGTTKALPNPAIYTVAWASGSAATFQLNYTSAGSVTTAKGIPQSATNIGFETDTGDSPGTNTISAYYIGIRVLPPNNVMPTIAISGGLTSSYTSPSTPTLTITPSPPANIDVPQVISVQASFTSGKAPFTYNYLIVNSLDGSITDNMLLSNSLTTNTFVFTSGNFYTSNSPIKVNVIVTDAYPTTVNSVYSANINVAQTLGSIITSFSNSLTDSGQIQKITTVWSGGSLPFTVKLYNLTSGLGFLALPLGATFNFSNLFGFVIGVAVLAAGIWSGLYLADMF